MKKLSRIYIPFESSSVRKRFFLLLMLALPLYTTAQQQNVYKGTIVDYERKPIELFSVMVINVSDTTKQLLGKTFTDGGFEFSFSPENGERYDVFILAMGYRDMRIPLEKMRDTIVMKTQLVQLEDAIVEGKREVTSKLGTEGGVFSTSETHICHILARRLRFSRSFRV